MKFTVFGGDGFIGSKLVTKLMNDGHQVFVPNRNCPTETVDDLGHIVYCIGLTSDFRTRPFDTMEAHICLWSRILQQATFETCTYLSSTRLYLGSNNTNETAQIEITPLVADDLYAISKLAGESLCLASNKGKIIRLSNVVGEYNKESPDFLNEIITMAREGNEVTLNSAIESEKDYIMINDVVDLIPRIILSGKDTIYNVASGNNLSNEDILVALGVDVNLMVKINKNAVKINHPKINISRISNEFDFSSSDVIKYLSSTQIHNI